MLHALLEKVYTEKMALVLCHVVVCKTAVA